MPKYAKQRDGNEKDIVAALVDAGASVTRLGDFGVPDLLVGYDGKTFLLEVKVPSRADGKAHTRKGIGGEGELTSAQVRFWESWKGGAMSIVRSPADALTAIGAARG